MKDMAGQVAIVTGGASGMGQIIARRLARTGRTGCDIRCERAGAGSNSRGVRQHHCVPLRYFQPGRCRKPGGASVVRPGPIDLLVHAAALMPSHKLAEHTHEGMETLFRINYFGTTYMVRAVLPEMLQRKTGRIIAFGSIAGIALVPKMGAYCATKAAVNAYMEVLQNEMRGTGVRAHLVCPPAVNTALIDQSLATDSPGSLVEARKNGRLADPEKIVNAIEKGVAKDRDIIYPGEARLLYLWRALFPRLWWKTVLHFEK